MHFKTSYNEPEAYKPTVAKMDKKKRKEQEEYRRIEKDAETLFKIKNRDIYGSKLSKLEDGEEQYAIGRIAKKN